jgi:hypothetical protein
VALVPPGVVTVMSTVPAAWAGEVAVMVVALTTVKPLAATVPNVTADAPVKFVPVMVMPVLPAVLPVFGVTAVTVGAGTVYVKWSEFEIAEKPPYVFTVTSTVPPGLAGDVAVIDVSEFTVKLAGTSPKKTPVAPVKLLPVIITDVPPARLPELGLTPVTEGAEAALKVYRSPETGAEVPPGAVTRMSQVPPG